MYNFLKLVRFQNLLIVAATQYAMRYLIIYPMLNMNGFELQLDNFSFFLLVLATMCVTAAGYVINDYFDTKTDLLNRPREVIVGKKISRRTAMIFHIVLNAVGVLLGTYVSFLIGVPMLSFIFLLTTGILWFYSTTYKRQFFVGNFIVAVLTAMVPLMVVVFEIPLLNKTYGLIMLRNNASFLYIFGWVGGFAYFAFFMTLIREIIKDTEDFEGDQAFGLNTLPIAIGVRKTKLILYVLINFVIVSLVYINITYLKDSVSLIYMLFTIIFSLVFLQYKLYNAHKQKHYHVASNLTKFIMLFGILYALVADLIIHFTY